jgi:serine/threonine protein kinase
VRPPDGGLVGEGRIGGGLAEGSPATGNQMEAGRQRQFRIHHCLGRGGFGEVYRATMVAPGGISSDVAVKLLRVDVDPGGEAVRRLRDEGRLLSVVRHPAILRVFDLALLDGRIGLVTEYVEGEDLASLIGQLPPRAALDVVAAVAEALDAAWNDRGPDGAPLRLVHRDIKPSNIRISRRGEVKVLDFGIARSMANASDREARTGTGSTVGSLAYMAPERFGRGPAAPSADVFGLGCCLYELLSGRRLFEEAVPVEMFRLAAEQATFDAHLAEALSQLGQTGPGMHVSAEIRAVVAAMLGYEPDARPTAGEVRATCEALTEAAEGVPLKRWAREREWPGSLTVAGYLEGRVITEGTLSTGAFDGIAEDRSSETFQIDLGPSLSARPPSPAIASRRWPGGLVAVALVLLVFAIGAVAAQFAPRPGRRATPAAAVLVQPAQVPASEPVPAAPASEPGPRPEPEPPSDPSESDDPSEPSAPSPPVGPPVTRIVPDPLPEPVAPAPEPTNELDGVSVLDEGPELLPIPPADPGRVVVRPKTVRIELHAGGRVVGPGEAAPGRYELFADFGYGMVNVGKLVDVVSGYETMIRCNTLRHTCDVAN